MNLEIILNKSIFFSEKSHIFEAGWVVRRFFDNPIYGSWSGPFSCQKDSDQTIFTMNLFYQFLDILEYFVFPKLYFVPQPEPQQK